MTDKAEIAEGLLGAFFPPPPVPEMSEIKVP